MKKQRPIGFYLFPALALLISILGAPTTCAHAQTNKRTDRPTIGLVLAGGGALGFAHVGVLQILEEHRIPVDVITGTSMGAIVGAAYAAGVQLNEMQDLLSETDWDDLFSEGVPRRGIPYRFKSGRDREIYGDAKLSFRDGSLILPSGLVTGQKVLPLLQQLYGKVPNPVAFDTLPLRFRAVTADIETGEAFIPAEGDLARVVRASMSVPGFFAPVEIDGRLLVDGGITNNLPIDEALRLGADILIVVELYADLKKSAELTNPLSITGQIVSLLLAQNSAQQRLLMRDRDILIEPEIKGFSSTDFAKAKDLMSRGYEAAAALIPILTKLSIPDEDYDDYQRARVQATRPPTTIKFIRIKNESDVPDELIRSWLSFEEGDKLNRSIIEKDIEELYAWGFFSKVSYSVLNQEEGDGIEIEMHKKPWYSEYMRIGVALEDDFKGDSDYRLGLSYRQTNINSYGAYADLDLEIGRTPGFSAELYQPWGPESPYFIAPLAALERSQLQVRSGSSTVAEYQRLNGILSMQMGRRLGKIGETGVGIDRGFGEVKRDIGDPSLSEFSYDIGDAFARLAFDALDAPDFPTSGFLVKTQYRSALEELGSSNEFDSFAGGIALPITFGRNTLLLNGDFGVTLDDRPIERYYSIGGFRDLSGFERGSLLASDYGIGRILFYRRFSEIKSPIFGLDFFAGASIEFATLRSDVAAIPDQSLIVAGSTFIGLDTPVLPAYFGVGFNDENEAAVYFALGRVGNQR